MKLKITPNEAELLLHHSNAKTIEFKGLDNFRTAYLDYVNDHKDGEDYIVSIDEYSLFLFDSKTEALNHYNQLK